MSATDIELMPNVQRLLVGQGARRSPTRSTRSRSAARRGRRSSPASTPTTTASRATSPRTAGTGCRSAATPCRAGSQDAGYHTALIGKWLNGYGARDAHGEVPKGFDIWRGLLDVSAYDYSNFVMNVDGKLKTWGDAEFARKLVEFATIEVDDQPDSVCRRSSPSSRSCSGRARTATGAPTRPRTTRPT